jgi:hypothetical protein
MSEKKINSYDDLEKERKRLMEKLRAHEELIKVDIAGVREGLKPFGKAMETLNKMATRDNTAPVFNFGLEMGIDLFVRKFLLARAGWLTKIVVPFIVKNYSSHFIGEEKRLSLLNKVKGFFQKIRPKPQSTDIKTHNKLEPSQTYNTTDPDVTPRREGGGDAIAESSPISSRADEIVFANEKTENAAFSKTDISNRRNDTDTQKSSS